MRIHWVQHVSFEGLGAIEPWAQRHGHSLTATRQWAGDTLPPRTDFDAVVVMGGPMSVNDHHSIGWMPTEIAWLQQVMAHRMPLLGICLGAQLINAALGGSVQPMGELEVGWFPLSSNASSPIPLPRHCMAYHWHGERCQLPEQAQLLASSQACTEQVMLFNEHTLGLQCHLEMTPAGARALAENCPADLHPGLWVQSVDEQLADTSLFDQAHGILANNLDHLFGEHRA